MHTLYKLTSRQIYNQIQRNAWNTFRFSCASKTRLSLQLNRRCVLANIFFDQSLNFRELLAKTKACQEGEKTVFGNVSNLKYNERNLK